MAITPKSMIRSFVRSCPFDLKAAVARSMAEDSDFVRRYGRQLLADFAPRLGINAFRASGSYGDILSAPADRSVFAAYAESGAWATSTNAVLSDFFKAYDGGTYLDIGANIGLTTIPLARSSKVSCFAFEPDPTNFRNLVANIALNCPDADVRLFQSALFNKEAELEFELAESNLGDHRIRLNGGKGREGEEKRRTVGVRAARLDDLIPSVITPLAAKIDTQGSEPFVIEGGYRTLAQAGLLLLEWWPYGMARMTANPHIVIDLLRDNFSLGSLTPGEAETVSELLPIKELCSRLHATLDRNSEEHQYFDVTVRKQAEA